MGGAPISQDEVAVHPDCWRICLCYFHFAPEIQNMANKGMTFVLAGDMNGHVGSSNAGYDKTHGGFGYGDSNADGSKISEFADGLN